MLQHLKRDTCRVERTRERLCVGKSRTGICLQLAGAYKDLLFASVQNSYRFSAEGDAVAETTKQPFRRGF